MSRTEAPLALARLFTPERPREAEARRKEAAVSRPRSYRKRSGGRPSKRASLSNSLSSPAKYCARRRLDRGKSVAWQLPAPVERYLRDGRRLKPRQNQDFLSHLALDKSPKSRQTLHETLGGENLSRQNSAIFCWLVSRHVTANFVDCPRKEPRKPRLSPPPPKAPVEGGEKEYAWGQGVCVCVIFRAEAGCECECRRVMCVV